VSLKVALAADRVSAVIPLMELLALPEMIFHAALVTNGLINRKI
jgi:hypothetical protein